VKKINSEKTVDRNGVLIRVITYDDGTVEERAADPLATDEWKEKAGGPIGLNADGTKPTEAEIEALRKALYGNKK